MKDMWPTQIGFGLAWAMLMAIGLGTAFSQEAQPKPPPGKEVVSYDGSVEQDNEFQSKDKHLTRSPDELEGAIITKNFTPPTEQWSFADFETDTFPKELLKHFKGNRFPKKVDVIAGPETLINIEVQPEDEKWIKVVGLESKNKNAGRFPMQCEGNLKPPESGGGSDVTPKPEEKHWAVKVMDVKPEMVSVEWKEYDKPDNSPLDNNPNAGGGLRIFPGHIGPDDKFDRKTVWIVASITPKQAGVTVHFRVFDVDDPSSNAAPIDPDGPSGNDNRGTQSRLKQYSAVTDAGGIASVAFDVSTVQGNNFRAAASLERRALDALTVLVPAGGVPLVTPDDNRISGFSGAVTRMLTVWRKVYFEVDVMETPTFDENTWLFTYKDTRKAYANGITWCDYAIGWDPAEADFLLDDYWKDGVVEIGGSYSTVHASKKVWYGYNQIAIDAPLVANNAIGAGTIGDDDFYDGGNYTVFKGKTRGCTDPIVPPDNAAKNVVINAYRPCYMEVVFREECNGPKYDFDIWTDNANEIMTWLVLDDYNDNQKLERSEKYLTMTASVLFQPNMAHDLEPMDETLEGWAGCSKPGYDADLCLLFWAVILESTHGNPPNVPAVSHRYGRTLAHEMGHCYGCGDQGKGLMESAGNNDVFEEADIGKIRDGGSNF